ncbi:serine hydrolase FSH [Infundibulicybe gibba]|nr:serine hydrolase FSH [Infundibulicybe gibba]
MTIPRTVLVLHGYSQNANIFSKRLGALRKECGKDVEMVFLDGPHILQPVDLVGSPSAALPTVEAPSVDADPALTPRAWWKVNRERTKAFGLEESLMLVRETLRSRKFDGVLGFSQGAAFAAVIAALLERPHLYPPFLIDGQAPHPPLQFCLAISGFKLVDPIVTPLFVPSYSTPTLHVIGRTDIVVVEERSRLLIDVSSNKRVEEHEGGHFVPSKAGWRKFLRDYMKDPHAELPSPGLGDSSTPATSSRTGRMYTMGSFHLLKFASFQ